MMSASSRGWRTRATCGRIIAGGQGCRTSSSGYGSSHLRIGLISQWYAPETGAAAVPTVLARQLAARSHDVTVLTGLPNYPMGELHPGYKMRLVTDEVGDGGERIRRVALYPSHDRSQWRRSLNYGSFAVSASLVGLGALRGVDAFWVYNSPATVGLPTALAGALWRAPHLLHVMDLWPDTIRFSGMSTDRSYRALEALLGHWCQTTYRRASAIACISPGAVDVLVERGVRPDKLHYIPVWADEATYYPRPADAALVSELGTGDGFTLLYAGNLGQAQGLDVLLEACARVGDLSGFRCLIAGSGTAEGELRHRASVLGLGNVSFLGRWPASDMGRLIAVADACLVSLNDDPLSAITMPSKLPAILACGRSVLACAGGDVAQLVDSSGAGWTAKPGSVDDLEAAIRQANSESRQCLDERGRRARGLYEDHFALAHGIDAIEGLLEKMAVGRRARGG